MRARVSDRLEAAAGAMDTVMLDSATRRSSLLEIMQLHGLDDTDWAHSLFVCVRELFENALDASTKSRVAKVHHILVTIAPVYAQTGLYTVSVTDNGRGFSEKQLQKVGVGSNKQAGFSELSDLSAGVFGVGINTVLVWAHMHGGEPVSITSAGTHGGEPMDVLKLDAALLLRQNPSCVPALDLWTSLTRLRQAVSAGTRVSCVLAGGDAVAEHVESYFACVASLCVPSELCVTLNLLLEGHSGEATPGDVRQQEQVLKIPATPFDHICLQADPVPTIDGAVNQLREQALRLRHDLLTTHGVGRAIVEDKGAARSAPKGFVHATLLLGAAHSAATGVCTTNFAAHLAPSLFADDNHADSDDLRQHRLAGDAAVEVQQRHDDVARETQGGFSGYLTAEEGVVGGMHSQPSHSERLSSSPLQVLLFLNNKPLRLGWAEPPVQCATFVAFRKVSWKTAGLGLRMRPLQLVGGHTPLRGAWAIVHLLDPAARFGDLGKSYVKPTKPLTKAISAAVTNALTQARQGWAESGLLLSAEERWRHQLGRSAEHIARNVSGLIAVLRHADERRECLRLLGAVDVVACEGIVRGRLRSEWQYITHTQVRRRQSKSRPGLLIEGDDDSLLVQPLNVNTLRNDDHHDDFDPTASCGLSPGGLASGTNGDPHGHLRRGAWHRWPSSSRSSVTHAIGRKRGTPDVLLEHGDDGRMERLRPSTVANGA